MTQSKQNKIERKKEKEKRRERKASEVLMKSSITYLCVIETGRSITNFTFDIGEYASRSITCLLCIVAVVEIVTGIGHTHTIAGQPHTEQSNCP